MVITISPKNDSPCSAFSVSSLINGLARFSAADAVACHQTTAVWSKGRVPVESHQNAGFVWGKRGQMMDFSGELEVYLELWIIFTEKLWNMWKHEVWFHPHNWRSIWSYSWCRIAELVEMSWSIAVDCWVYAIDMSIVRRGKFNSTSCKLTDVENPTRNVDHCQSLS